MDLYLSFEYEGKTYHLKRLGGLEYFQSFGLNENTFIKLGDLYVNLVQLSIVNERGEKSFTLEQVKKLPHPLLQSLFIAITKEHADMFEKYNDLDNIKNQAQKELGLYQIAMKSGIDIDEIRGWPLEKQMGWKFALQEMNRLEEEAYSKATGKTLPSTPNIPTQHPHQPQTSHLPIPPSNTRKFVVGADGDLHIQD